MEPVTDAAIVWFIVLAARAWVVNPVLSVLGAGDWLNGPHRIWPLVYGASLLLLLIDAGFEHGVDEPMIREAFTVALAAIGIDNVQRHIPAAASGLNLKVGKVPPPPSNPR